MYTCSQDALPMPIENYWIKRTQDHLIMRNFSGIDKSTSCLTSFKRHLFGLKIFHRNALLEKYTAAVFSVIALDLSCSSLLGERIYSTGYCTIDHSKKRWRHVDFTVILCEHKLYLILATKSLTCQHRFGWVIIILANFDALKY